jgi:hypothetical protein
MAKTIAINASTVEIELSSPPTKFKAELELLKNRVHPRDREFLPHRGTWLVRNAVNYRPIFGIQHALESFSLQLSMW